MRDLPNACETISLRDMMFGNQKVNLARKKTDLGLSKPSKGFSKGYSKGFARGNSQDFARRNSALSNTARSKAKTKTKTTQDVCSGSFYWLRRGVLVHMKRVENLLKVQWQVLVGIEGLSRCSSYLEVIVDEFSLGNLIFGYKFMELRYLFSIAHVSSLSLVHIQKSTPMKRQKKQRLCYSP
ncbi:hypothetical protein YC2023_048177 [Brassica napus]